MRQNEEKHRTKEESTGTTIVSRLFLGSFRPGGTLRRQSARAECLLPIGRAESSRARSGRAYVAVV